MPTSLQAQRVAATVRAEMARRKMTQQALADALGHNQAWMWRRLSGEVAIRTDELQSIADVLRVPVGLLLGETAGAA